MWPDERSIAGALDLADGAVGGPGLDGHLGGARPGVPDVAGRGPFVAGPEVVRGVNADRTRGVGVPEGDPAVDEPVEGRRVDGRVGERVDRAGAVLVRHHERHVGPTSPVRSSIPRSGRSGPSDRIYPTSNDRIRPRPTVSRSWLSLSSPVSTTRPPRTSSRWRRVDRPGDRRRRGLRVLPTRGNGSSRRPSRATDPAQFDRGSRRTVVRRLARAPIAPASGPKAPPVATRGPACSIATIDSAWVVPLTGKP